MSVFSKPRRFVLVILLPLIVVAIILSLSRQPRHSHTKKSVLGSINLNRYNPLVDRTAQEPLGDDAPRTKTWTSRFGAHLVPGAAGDDDGEDFDAERSEEQQDGSFGQDDDGFDRNVTTLTDRGDYRELFSLSTRDRKFIPIHMDGLTAWNPSLIPHPTRADEWIAVSQSTGQMTPGVELTCSVGMLNDVLVCSDEPEELPVAKSIVGKCEAHLAIHNFWTGPRDARVFYGPDSLYIIYGSQASYTCLGLWLQDARPLLEPFHIEQATGNKLFRDAQEIRRAAPWGPIEKNYFLFWGNDSKAYVHFDVYPQRAFAALDFDGSAGVDLAPWAARSDKFCMAQYMPVPLAKNQQIHQATNSLWITLCKRADPGCHPDDENTFIMHIFHFKTILPYETEEGKREEYTLFDPYVMLMRRSAPFAIHGIGQKPLWIHGRESNTIEKQALEKPQDGQSLYFTSISWKRHGQKHHGYLDDPIFLGFGIDNSRPAAIDIIAEDLIVDLAFCS